MREFKYTDKQIEFLEFVETHVKRNTFESAVIYHSPSKIRTTYTVKQFIYDIGLALESNKLPNVTSDIMNCILEHQIYYVSDPNRSDWVVHGIPHSYKIKKSS